MNNKMIVLVIMAWFIASVFCIGASSGRTLLITDEGRRYYIISKTDCQGDIVFDEYDAGARQGTYHRKPCRDYKVVYAKPVTIPHPYLYDAGDEVLAFTRPLRTATEEELKEKWDKDYENYQKKYEIRTVPTVAP